jgi:DNA-binding transcriptional LysR family regulator
MEDLDLAELDVFVAVARLRSFRGAAKTRSMSPSALSEAIRRLESRLGVRLLNRTTRSVTPTEAGQQLLERLSPAFGEVRAALDALGSYRGTVAGTLRLNVPTVAADLILADLLPRFLKAHPDILVEAIGDDQFIDVLAAGYDAGIRYDEAVERDMIAIPIGPRVQRFLTVASPAFLESHGAPMHPNDLLNLPCIRHRFASGTMLPWEFSREGESIKIMPKGPLIANRIDVQIKAAEAGLGLFHGFEGFLNESINRGRLVRILPEWEEPFTGPFLYYASRRLMPGPLRAFVDFVKRQPGD